MEMAGSSPSSVSTHEDNQVETAQPIAPISSGERVHLIDSYRGLAILGILMVNMGVFAFPIYRLFGYNPAAQTPVDMVVEWGIRFLFEGKFYIIFSFMFGLGMAVQKDRCEATGRPFAAFFAKRMVFLCLLGAVHGFLIWSGDILLTYGLMGFGLLLFRNLKPRGLLIWAGIFFSAMMGLVCVFWVILRVMETTAPEQLLSMTAANKQMIAERYDAAMQVFSSGNYAAMTVERAIEFSQFLSQIFATGPMILISFLMGAWAWRKGIFQDPAAHKNLLKRVMIWGGLIGVVGSAMQTVAKGLELMGSDNVLGQMGVVFGGYALGYSYLAALALLYCSGKAKGFFTMLEPVGRMALTNYLTHSVVFTFVFYNHGLGLIGTIGDSTGLLLTLTMFLVQIPLSHWWLSRFRFGPVEWLWRCFTYGSLQPLRRRETVAA
jgi:uncharacterized protein